MKVKKMKVKIKDLHPNPFRDLASYPFRVDKIEALKKSINQTGFWDNVIGRQLTDGTIQIAYGHHRLKALQECFNEDYMIEMPIKPLSDEDMLKIMANENMEEWQSSTAVVDETVKATKKFLLEAVGAGTNDTTHWHTAISEFLGWSEFRVKASLARINAIEDNSLDKGAVDSLNSISHATEFNQAVSKNKVSIGKQKKLAEDINELDLGKRQVKDYVEAVTQAEKKAETFNLSEEKAQKIKDSVKESFKSNSPMTKEAVTQKVISEVSAKKAKKDDDFKNKKKDEDLLTVGKFAERLKDKMLDMVDEIRAFMEIKDYVMEYRGEINEMQDIRTVILGFHSLIGVSKKALDLIENHTEIDIEEADVIIKKLKS